MKIKFLSATLIGVLFLNIAAIAIPPAPQPASQPADLLRSLPNVDAVATVDIRQFLNHSLPNLLQGNPPMLAEFNKMTVELKQKVGIDIRQFRTAAIGAAIKPGTDPKNIDQFKFDPVFALRGDVSAPGIIALAKAGGKGGYTEEKIGTRSVLIFDAKDAVVTKDDTLKKAVDKVDTKIALAAFDQNTIVGGKVELLKEMLEGGSTIDPTLPSLVESRSTFFNFAMKMPADTKSLFGLEDDEFGNNLGSIKYVFGGFDFGVDGANIDLNARSETAESATSLKDLLEGLHMLGISMLAESPKTELQVAHRILESTKISSNATDVTLSFKVAQKDIDDLIASAKTAAATAGKKAEAKPAAKKPVRRTARRSK